jgi:uncharacterized protein (TIGR03435 family)
MSWESQAVALLSASILRPFLLAAAAWLLLLVLRVRHPASRHAVWTAVLIGIPLLPLVSVLTPHWTAILLPPKYESQAVVQPAPPVPLLDRRGSVASTPSPEPLPVPSRARQQAIPQHTFLWLYFAGLLAMLTYRAAGWVLLRRVLSRSTRLHEPRLRESADVVSPVAVGVFRPTVLLPVTWRNWSSTTRSAVLAHEFAHLRRGDTIASALARFVKCILWFHPLAWWISRQISELAELACDAEALQTVGDPGGYSRVLLQFAGEVKNAGYRVALPGLAIANSSELSRRIDQVFELSTGKLRRLQRPAAVLALMGVPALCAAATVGLGSAAVAVLSRGELSALLRMPSAPLVSPIAVAQLRIPAASSTAPVRDRSVIGPRFETASLEIAAPPISGELCWGGCGGPLSPYPESRDEITYRHFTLRKILSRAYNVKDYLISGPKSLDADAYDVSAKAAPGTTQEQFQLMLRSLLAERLKFEAHIESRDFVTGYQLGVASGGPKLKEIQGSETNAASRLPELRDGGIWVPVLTIRNGETQVTYMSGPALPVGQIGLPNKVTSARDLALIFTLMLSDRVTDKTGLTGAYDFDLARLPASLLTARPAPMATRQDPPNSFEVIRSGLEQLGLTLEVTRIPTDVLVVDRVEPPPAAK